MYCVLWRIMHLCMYLCSLFCFVVLHLCVLNKYKSPGSHAHSDAWPPITQSEMYRAYTTFFTDPYSVMQNEFTLIVRTKCVNAA